MIGPLIHRPLYGKYSYILPLGRCVNFIVQFPFIRIFTSSSIFSKCHKTRISRVMAVAHHLLRWGPFQVPHTNSNFTTSFLLRFHYNSQKRLYVERNHNSQLYMLSKNFTCITIMITFFNYRKTQTLMTSSLSNNFT